ncbi:hypothetical protein U5N28_18700 [Lysinibacillus telephonicus]|uniref:hypothetical protein n=1 Tax=Lysinibacillus telephonicus TaxID=1714840 RepID=UPI00163AA0E1|nr:hypothetical protein [Lysinibacillus telephonicus]
MNLRLKVYLGCIILIPFLITAMIRGLALVPEEMQVIVYFLAFIATHLVVSKIQELMH